MAERSFESLRVWQDSRKFVNDIYDMMVNCRVCEDRKFCTPERRVELHNKLMSISSGLFKLVQYLSNKTH